MSQDNKVAGATPTMNVMVIAAEKAARSLVRDFGEVENLQVSVKGPGDFVSNADRKAEKILIQELQKARPKYNFLVEESGEIPGEDPDYCWIIDPLDGTTNFLHGIPHFAISIALEKRGEIIAAVILDPIKNELFTAEKGRGAFFNKRKLRVSGRDKLNNCVVGTGIPIAKDKAAETIAQITAVNPHVAAIRSLGATVLDLAYVAAGRYDALWRNSFQTWDVAAGMLLIQEAGGKVTMTDGAEFDFESSNILATNAKIHEQMMKML